MLVPDSILHDHYRITYVVDERSDEVLYRAIDQRNAYRVLIAALPQVNEEALDQIQELARQISLVQTPGLLSLRDYFAEGLTFYMVSDDPGGQDLDRVAREFGGRIAEAEVLMQVERLLGTLEVLHTRKPSLLLGDLRSTDLWSSPEGDLSLAPFVLARPVGTETSPYRAPELSDPQTEPATSSDLYAMGAVFYQLITGWTPPPAPLREAGTPLNAPRTLNPQVSGLAEQMILRALEMKPANRYHMAREMRRALDTVRLMGGRPLGADAPVGASPVAEPGNAAQQAPPVAPPPVQPPVQPPAPSISVQPPAYQPSSGWPGTQPGQGRSPEGYSPPPPAPPVAVELPPASAGYAQQGVGPPPAGYAAPQPRQQSNTCLIIAVVVLSFLALLLCVALLIVGWFLLQPGANFFPWQNVPGSLATAPAPTTALAPTSAAPANTAPEPTQGPVVASDPDVLSLANVQTITETQQFTETQVGTVLYAPDGSLFAAVFGDAIDLRDGTTFEVQRTLKGHQGEVIGLAFSPIAAGAPLLLASTSVDETVVRIWDTQTGTLLRELKGHSGWVRSVAFSPDGTVLATGSIDTEVKLWNVQTGELLRTLQGHTGWVAGVMFSPDGARLVSTSRDGTVRLWDVASGSPVQDFNFEAPLNPATSTPYWTTGVAFSPDGTLIAVGAIDANVYVLNAASGALERTLEGHNDLITFRGVAFSPNGSMLATASNDGNVRLWDARTGAERGTLRLHGLDILSISWSSDGTRLASSGDQTGEVLIWDVATQRVTKTIRFGQGMVRVLMFTPDGEVLGTGGINGTIRLHVLAKNESETLVGGAPSIQYIGFIGNSALVGIRDTGKITVVDTSEDNPPVTLEGLSGPAFSVVVSPNETMVAAGGDNGQLIIWETQNWQQVRTLKGLDGLVFSMAFSNDGRRLAAFNNATPPVIAVWDVPSSQLLYTLSDHAAPILALAVQPQGNLLVSTSRDGLLRIWDLNDGLEIRRIKVAPEGRWLSSATFTPDGTMLVTGSLDGVLEFWDPVSGELVHIFDTQQGDIVALAFSYDGKQLAASTRYGGVRLFRKG